MTDSAPEFDAFISYSHQDSEFVSQLASQLRAQGLKIFLDTEEFIPGTSLVLELERAIQSSRKTILVISPDYLESAWTEFENLLAQTLDPSARRQRIIPILYRKTKLPLRLSTMTYIDFTDKSRFDWGISRLVSVLKPPDVAVKLGDIHVDESSVSGVSSRVTNIYTSENQNLLLEQIVGLNRQILSILINSQSKPSGSTNDLFSPIDGVVVDPKLCFVLMPFSPDWSRPLFDKHIKTACEKEFLVAKRSDDIFSIRNIIQDIWIFINQARIVIADLTTRNPNVFYEVGLAHSLGKDVVLITQSMDDVPFDLRGVRCIVYSLQLDGPKKLEDDLKRTLRSIIQKTPD